MLGLGYIQSYVIVGPYITVNFLIQFGYFWLKYFENFFVLIIQHLVLLLKSGRFSCFLLSRELSLYCVIEGMQTETA